MSNHILISLPKLTSQGGVSSYWNSILSPLRENNHIETVEIGGHGKNLLGAFIDQWRFYKRIRKTPPRVSILNPSLGFNSFFRDGLFAKQLSKRNIPFFVFFHGWNPNFEHKISKKYIEFFLSSFGEADRIFVLSSFARDKIIEWGYRGDVTVETTAVDSSLIRDFSINQKFKLPRESKTIKILFLARLVREKGIYELIEAFINISKEFTNLELIIAGEGEVGSHLKLLTFNINSIKFVGHVEGREKISIFSDADIYLLPSYSEGLPISVLEAMAFALPVITTDVGGLKEFFKDGKMGYFVKPTDTKEIEERLKYLVTDIEKIIEIGRYNYEYATKNLLNHTVAKRLDKYIKEVIDDR